MQQTLYEQRITERSLIKFYIGLIPRYVKYLKNQNYLRIAKRNGASIGTNTVISRSLAEKANSNLTIGNNSSIQSDNFDLRSKVKIGNNVIIGENVKIITASHNINSVDWEVKYYGITVEDFVWLATDVLVMPSCRLIEYGAVFGGGSVVVKDVEKMAVVSGNPAVKISERITVHKSLVVESLLGADLKEYIKVYRNKNIK